jgi:ATP-dependent DNA helicase RecG
VEINEKQNNIVLLIRENPAVTTRQLAEKIGAADYIVQNNLKILKDKGVITREGSKKKGKWIMKKATIYKN